MSADFLVELKSVLTNGIILMLISLLIALILLGNKTFPLENLPALNSQVRFIVLICRGNVFQLVIAGLLLVMFQLIAANLVPLITPLAEYVDLSGHEIVLRTSLTDGGGNPLRHRG